MDGEVMTRDHLFVLIAKEIKAHSLLVIMFYIYNLFVHRHLSRDTSLAGIAKLWNRDTVVFTMHVTVRTNDMI